MASWAEGAMWVRHESLLVGWRPRPRRLPACRKKTRRTQIAPKSQHVPFAASIPTISRLQQHTDNLRASDWDRHGVFKLKHRRGQDEYLPHHVPQSFGFGLDLDLVLEDICIYTGFHVLNEAAAGWWPFLVSNM